MTDEQFAALLERLDRLERAVGLMRLAPSPMPLEIGYRGYGPALQDPRLPTFRDLSPGLPDPAYSPYAGS